MLVIKSHDIKDSDVESVYSRQRNAISTLCSTVIQTPFPVYTAEKTRTML